jgi:hypothetical protein
MFFEFAFLPLTPDLDGRECGAWGTIPQLLWMEKEVQS